jgi:hypothetical protein
MRQEFSSDGLAGRLLPSLFYYSTESQRKFEKHDTGASGR